MISHQPCWHPSPIVPALSTDLGAELAKDRPLNEASERQFCVIRQNTTLREVSNLLVRNPDLNHLVVDHSVIEFKNEVSVSAGGGYVIFIVSFVFWLCSTWRDC